MSSISLNLDPSLATTDRKVALVVFYTARPNSPSSRGLESLLFNKAASPQAEAAAINVAYSVLEKVIKRL